MLASAESKWRVGLIVPSSNTVMEVDFYRHLPPEVTVHTARMYMVDTTVAGETRALREYAPKAARDLATVQPHLVVFGCTSASALFGMEGEEDLRHTLSAITGVPTLSVIGAVHEALAAARAARVAVITPYVEELNQRIESSLQEKDLQVVAIHGLGIDVNFELASVPPQRIAEFARKSLGGVDADAVFVSCTNFRALEALPLLRDIFDVPVVTSNQAAMDATLRALEAVKEENGV